VLVTTGFAFDRFTADNLADPYPLYHRMREEQPVFFAEAFGVWVVSRYDDVRQVLMDPARFSSAFQIRTPHAPAPGVLDILAEGHPEVPALLNEDPPDHRRTRDLVAKTFSARRIAGLEPGSPRSSPSCSTPWSCAARPTWSPSWRHRCRCR
jgi:cytochrome P450